LIYLLIRNLLTFVPVPWARETGIFIMMVVVAIIFNYDRLRLDIHGILVVMMQVMHVVGYVNNMMLTERKMNEFFGMM